MILSKDIKHDRPGNTYGKKILFTLVLLAFAFGLKAQYRVTFILQSIPQKPSHPAIYLAGNINGWNPHDEKYAFRFLQGNYTLTTTADSGEYVFKLTRGSWETVECDARGGDISNRSLSIHSDTVIHIYPTAWKDQFQPKPKSHTMSANVHIIDTAFLIPQLNRTRRIWIYLPPDYTSTTKRYPVLYMQDGQNLFDAATSAYGEWGIDEILDSLIQQGGPGVIIVGIDHGGDKRLNEYNPYDNDKYGKGEGKAYAAFLVNTLKPFIDKHFRTLTDAPNTGIAGSSMGGLISFYTWLKYPGIFGKAGIFSPSFWIAPQIKNDIHLKENQLKDYVYFIAGDSESTNMVSDMQSIFNDMIQQGFPKDHMEIKVIPGGTHSESYWHREFGQVYLWLFLHN